MPMSSFTFRDEDGFGKKVNQDYLQAVEVLFLKRYLLGEND
jgi:hypothetical protein